MYCNPSEPTVHYQHHQPPPPPVMMDAHGGGLMAVLQPNVVGSNSATRVSFHDTRREVRVVSLACLSDELRRDIWYTPADIDMMRTEARDLCRFLRVNPQACPEEHTRGLELRISLERQCRKQMTVQGVVEAQRRCSDPAVLACLAQRASVLPKEMALAQARKDYSTVYVTTTTTTAAAASPDAAAVAGMDSPSAAATSPAACSAFPTAATAPPGAASEASAGFPVHGGSLEGLNNNNNNSSPHQRCHQQNRYQQQTRPQQQHQNHYRNNNNNNHMPPPMNQFLAAPPRLGFQLNYRHGGPMAPALHDLHQQHQHQHHQHQQHQQPSSLAADCSMEPIPLSSSAAAGAVGFAANSSPPDQQQASIMMGNNKRSFDLFEQNQQRIVRRRLEGYPAA